MRNRLLVGISQRHCSAHYPALKGDTDRIKGSILKFHQGIVRERFSGGANYVMDVYVDTKWRVWLIDFNVWGERTDSLLFSWDEPLLAGEPSISAAQQAEPTTGTSEGVTREEDPKHDHSHAIDNTKIGDAVTQGDVEEVPSVVAEQVAATTAAAPWSAHDVVLRLVVDGRTIRSDPLANYRAPLDMHELAGGGAAFGEAGADFQTFVGNLEAQQAAPRESGNKVGSD